AYASLLIVEVLMNLSNFESPVSKNLAGSSRVSPLKRFDTPKGGGGACDISALPKCNSHTRSCFL
ncbi:hypothetical protein, partial [Methanoregula sp.]|uniref:hypothetical protein n=1 Tax=Methanoregula sp. TaxID=2052170 RepID=UPI0025EAC18E